MIRFALIALLLATPAAAQRQGTLRLLSRTAAGTIDPHVNYTAQYWQLFCFLYDGLVAFRKVPGPSGMGLVPDLAEAVPTPEQGGTVYRFRLRHGIRFSDGREVAAADVVASFRRIFRVRSPTADTFYGAIEGAPACLERPDDCVLPGVAAEGDEIVIRLSHPEPEFLIRLALPHASIVPADAPGADVGTDALPGTGPYMVAAYDPSEGLRMVRNPYFREWSADAQPAGVPNRIDYEFGLEDEAEVTAVENGQADWMADAPPVDRLGELGERFLPLVHLSPAFALWFVPLNMHLPPFDDLRVRQAFNMAVDRMAVVKLFGGRNMAEPTCQVLPPGLPGYAAYCPYPHDLQRARRMVREAGAVGQSVTLVTDDSPVSRAVGTYLRDVLADLGFEAKLRSLSGNVQFSYIQNSNNRVQASVTGWYADYPSPGNFLLGVFGCAAFHEGSDSSPNISGFCEPALDAKVMDGIARGDWAEVAAVDRAMTDAAPAVVLFAPRYIDVMSPRVRGYAYHEVFRWLIDRASLE